MQSLWDWDWVPVPGLHVGTNEVLDKYFHFMNEIPKACRSEPDLTVRWPRN